MTAYVVYGWFYTQNKRAVYSNQKENEKRNVQKITACCASTVPTIEEEFVGRN